MKILQRNRSDYVLISWHLELLFFFQWIYRLIPRTHTAGWQGRMAPIASKLVKLWRVIIKSNSTQTVVQTGSSWAQAESKLTSCSEFLNYISYVWFLNKCCDKTQNHTREIELYVYGLTDSSSIFWPPWCYSAPLCCESLFLSCIWKSSTQDCNVR